MARRSTLKFTPNSSELKRLFSQHDTYSDRILTQNTGQFITEMKRFSKKSSLDINIGKRLPANKGSSDTDISNMMYMRSQGFQETYELAKFANIVDSYFKLKLSQPDNLYVCPVTLYYPSYHRGDPYQLSVISSPGYYPKSVAQSFPENGRLEVGSLAVKGLYQRIEKVNENQGEKTFGICEAKANVGILHNINIVNRPAIITVKAQAIVNARFLADAFIPSAEPDYKTSVGTKLDLILTVTNLDKPVDPIKYTVYNNIVSSGSFDDYINAKSFVLQSQFEITAPTLLIAKVSAHAISVVEEVDNSPGGSYSLVDAEGSNDSLGKYYPYNGNIYVTGFSITVCPKP